jgi:hypothetical protein
MAAPAEETVTIGVGEQRRIGLPGRGSGGFTWQVDVSGDADAITLGREAGARPALPPAGSAPPASFSLDEVLVIDGVRPGKVVLDARLARPGTAPDAAIERRRIRIVVTAAP